MIEEIDCEMCGDTAELDECPFCNIKLCDACMEEHSKVCIEKAAEMEDL